MTTPIHVTDGNFDELVLNADKPVLVDFWAEWCGPCRMVGPVVERLAAERDNDMLVVKLNIDENPGIAQRYGIMSIPTLVVFNDGAPVEGTVGAVPYEPLNEWLGSLIEQFRQQASNA